MRRCVQAVIPIFVPLIALSLPANSAEPVDQNLHIKTELTGKTKLSLNQQARKTLPRDRIKIALRIEVQGESSKALQEQINRLMPKVLELAGSSGAVWVETGSYRVFREPESNAHPERWHATQEVVIYSGQFAEALATAGKCQAIGLLMTNMAFFLAPETLAGAQSELTKQALDAIRSRADEIADDLTMKIDHYQNIAVGNAAETYENVRGPGASAPTGAERGTPAAQGGQSTVSVTVSADVVLAHR